MKLKEKMATRSNSLQWGHNEFEIAKYHPSKYNGEGVYTDTNEWTDYFDVGESVTLCHYLEMEMRYINTIIQILELTDCSFVTLVNYDNLRGYLVERKKNRPVSIKLNNGKYFYLSDEDIQLLLFSKVLKENSRISVGKLGNIIKLLLRNYINANICNESRKVYLEFPGSYYLWLKCPVQYYTTVSGIVKSNSLFLNPRNSSSCQ